MADPLSITASFITVISAVEGISKTFAMIRNVRHAPSEVLALINELSDLRSILEDIERYIIRDTNRLLLPPEQMQTISTLVDKSKDYLLELDQVIQYRLVKVNSTSAELRVSRLKWIAAKQTIGRLRLGLRDIRLNLVTQMIVISS